MVLEAFLTYCLVYLMLVLCHVDTVDEEAIAGAGPRLGHAAGTGKMQNISKFANLKITSSANCDNCEYSPRWWLCRQPGLSQYIAVAPWETHRGTALMATQAYLSTEQ